MTDLLDSKYLFPLSECHLLGDGDRSFLTLLVQASRNTKLMAALL